MKIGRATGGVSAVGKPGTANQFQRRELVAVPALRRAHRSAGGCIIAFEALRMTFIRLLIASALLGNAAQVSGQEDPAAAPKAGSVAGAAIDDKSGEGIAKALIILRRDQQGGLGEITDAKGKFTLRDVDPGVYTLSVERDDFVAAGEKSQTVSVQAGQT